MRERPRTRSDAAGGRRKNSIWTEESSILLFIGVAFFALAYSTFRAGLHLGHSPYPLWALFSMNATIASVGGVVTGFGERRASALAVPDGQVLVDERIWNDAQRELRRRPVTAARERSMPAPAPVPALPPLWAETPVEPVPPPVAEPPRAPPVPPPVRVPSMVSSMAFANAPPPESPPPVAAARPAVSVIPIPHPAPNERAPEPPAAAEPVARAAQPSSSIAASFAFAPALSPPRPRRRGAGSPGEGPAAPAPTSELVRSEIDRAVKEWEESRSKSDAPVVPVTPRPVTSRPTKCVGCATGFRRQGPAAICESCGQGVCQSCQSTANGKGHPELCPVCVSLLEASS